MPCWRMDLVSSSLRSTWRAINDGWQARVIVRQIDSINVRGTASTKAHYRFASILLRMERTNDTGWSDLQHERWPAQRRPHMTKLRQRE
jgi:hypothetical protein